MRRSLAAAALLLAPSLPVARGLAATLTVTVHGVRDDRGQIRIGVCRKAEFLSEACAFHAVVAAQAGDVSASIAAVPPGEYAVAVYQDRDGSGRLKRNFFGMPQEDVGFSRDPGLRFAPPAFAASAIAIGDGDLHVAVTLHRFEP